DIDPPADRLLDPYLCSGGAAERRLPQGHQYYRSDRHGRQHYHLAGHFHHGKDRARSGRQGTGQIPVERHPAEVRGESDGTGHDNSGQIVRGGIADLDRRGFAMLIILLSLPISLGITTILYWLYQHRSKLSEMTRVRRRLGVETPAERLAESGAPALI